MIFAANAALIRTLGGAGQPHASSGRVATSRLRRKKNCTELYDEHRRWVGGGVQPLHIFVLHGGFGTEGVPVISQGGVNWNSAHSFSPHRDRPNCLIKSSPPPSLAITLHPAPSLKNPINPWVCPPHTVCYRSLNVQRDQLTLRLSQLGSRSRSPRCIAFETHHPRATPPLQ